jgi:hypothetical protein
MLVVFLLLLKFIILDGLSQSGNGTITSLPKWPANGA